MYENSIELAENKLLLLYILNASKYPISNSVLTELVLHNCFLNYFTLQQYISELETAGFIKYEENNSKKLMYLTDKGINVLSFFENRISVNKKHIVDEYLDKTMESIKKELTIHADYTLEKHNSFTVNLKAIEGDIVLIDLKLNVVSKNQAISLCNRWKENSSEIYTKIIADLLQESFEES